MSRQEIRASVKEGVTSRKGSDRGKASITCAAPSYPRGLDGHLGMRARAAGGAPITRPCHAGQIVFTQSSIMLSREMALRSGSTKSGWRLLTLLLVAAVVFAPGWPEFHERAEERSDPRDLAARILAPTLDEGAVGQGSVEKLRQGPRGESKRLPPDVLLAATLAGLLVLFVASRACMLAPYRHPGPGSASHSTSTPRAPPLLQPA